MFCGVMADSNATPDGKSSSHSRESSPSATDVPSNQDVKLPHPPAEAVAVVEPRPQSDKSKRRSWDSSSAESGASINSDDPIDQWHRSVVINDVPGDSLSMLETYLELKDEGGGKIVSFIPKSTTGVTYAVLVTFEDSAVAQNLLFKESVHIGENIFKVSRAELEDRWADSLSSSSYQSDSRPPFEKSGFGSGGSSSHNSRPVPSAEHNQPNDAGQEEKSLRDGIDSSQSSSDTCDKQGTKLATDDDVDQDKTEKVATNVDDCADSEPTDPYQSDSRPPFEKSGFGSGGSSSHNSRPVPSAEHNQPNDAGQEEKSLRDGIDSSQSSSDTCDKQGTKLATDDDVDQDKTEKVATNVDDCADSEPTGSCEKPTKQEKDGDTDEEKPSDRAGDSSSDFREKVDNHVPDVDAGSTDESLRKTSDGGGEFSAESGSRDVDGHEPTETKTVLLSGIPEAFQETVELYIEAPRRGGGKFVSFVYNSKRQTAVVVFEEPDVARNLLAKGTLRIQGIDVTVSTVPTGYGINDDDVDNDDRLSETDERLLRTIVVHDVPIEMEEILFDALESPRKNGGPIESHDYDESTKKLTVCFEDKTVAESFLKQGRFTLDGTDYVVTPPEQLQSESVVEKWRQRTIFVYDVPQSMEERLTILLENKRKDGGEIESFKRHENNQLVMVTFVDPEVAKRFIGKEFVQVARTKFNITGYKDDVDIRPSPATTSTELPSISSDYSIIAPDESAVKETSTGTNQETDYSEHSLVNDGSEPRQPHDQLVDKRSIEVTNIPEKVLDESLRMMFESKRVTGIVGAEVTSIRRLNDTQAVVTFTAADVAQRLILKEFVDWKGKMLYIRPPSSVQPPVELPPSKVNDDDERTLEYACNDEIRDQGEACSLSSSVEVLNIPDGVDERQLTMIFESRRYTDVAGAEVSKVEFNAADRSRAVLTFTSAEVAQKIIAKEFITFKTHTYTVQVPQRAEPEPVEQKPPEVSPPSKTVLVSDVPANVDEEVLKMFFGNEKRSGGGEIETIDTSRAASAGVIVITFVKPEVAARLLSKAVITLKGQEMRVSEWNGAVKCENAQPDSSESAHDGNVDRKKVKVSNIPADVSEEVLLMVFENKRLCDGGEIDSLQYDADSGTAVITYKDETVTEAVLRRKSVTYKGHTLYVAEHIEQSSQGHDADSAGDDYGRSVKLTDIPDTISHDILFLLFENATKSGGGEIEHLDFTPGNSDAVVTYKDAKVAARVLARASVTYGKATMHVSTVTSSSAAAARSSFTSLPSMQAGSRHEAGSNTVKVTNIPAKFSKDMLRMYFENTKRSGGGDIENLEVVESKGKAFITFKDAGTAQRVVGKQPHSVSNAQLSICTLESAASVPVLAIEVSGILSDHSDDLIRLFFESQKKSGGGNVDELFIDRKNKRAVITFESHEAVERVIKRCPHVLDGESVKVVKLQPAPPPPIVNDGDVDPNRLLAKRLPCDTDAVELGSYLNRAGAIVHIVKLTVCKKPTAALLDLSQPPDYCALRQLVSSRPFKGTMISIQRVPQTCSIVVLDVADNVSDDLLTLYFERDGDVASVRRVDGNAIVTFDSHEGVKKVLKKSHTINGKGISIQPYYKWLGLPEPEIKEPTVISIKGDHKVIGYIYQSQELKSELETSLSNLDCTISWPKGNGQPMELKFKEGGSTRSPRRGWSAECQNIVQSYFSSIRIEKFNVLQEVWSDFKKQMEEKTKVGFKVRTGYDGDKCEMHILGQVEVVNAVKSLAEQVKADLEKKLEQRKSVVSETMNNLKKHQLMVLEASEHIKELVEKYPNVKMKLTPNELHMEGSANDIKQAKTDILTKLSTLFNASIPVSKAIESLVKLEAFRCHMKDLLRAENIVASWSVKPEEVEVYAFVRTDLDKAVLLISSEYAEKTVEMNCDIDKLLSQKPWKEFEQKLVEEVKMVAILKGSTNTLIVASVKNKVALVLERVEDFASRHTATSEEVPMMEPVVELIERCLRGDLNKLQSKLALCEGRIERFDDGNGSAGFRVTGSRALVKETVAELTKLADQVTAYDHDIDRPGIPAFLMSVNGKAVIAGMENKHRAVVRLGDPVTVDEATSASADAVSPGDVKHKQAVTSHQNILLVHGDITKYRVDAVVNAANKELHHIGGIALAIANAAGDDVIDECRLHHKIEGDVLAGSVYVGSSGRLPCKKIIHTVGPQWRGGQRDEENLLFAAISSAVLAAGENGFTTMAIPAVSAGIYGFPKDKATRIIVDAICDTLKDARCSTLKEVHIVDNDHKIVDMFLDALKSVPPPPVIEVPAGPRRQHRPQPQLPVPQPITPVPAIVTCFSPVPGKANVLRTPEGVEITLLKGEIAPVQVDAIVNTCSKDLKLDQGAVSKTILTKAGAQIQDEVKKNAKPGFAYGDIVETKGYNLSAKWVFHGACVNHDTTGRCEQVMRSLIGTSIKLAHEKKLKSLAMPAVGTGNLRVPPDFCASVMYDVMSKFSKAQPTTTLKDIRIVVYDKDLPTVKAFEDKIKDLANGGSPMPNQAQSGAPAAAAVAASISAAGSGPSPSLAGKVSFGRSTCTLTVANVKLSIEQGDITKQTSDAIVNSTDTNLTMEGEVAKAIVSAAGDRLRDALKKVRIGRNGLCVTPGFNLPAKNIVHLAAAWNYAKWKVAIMNCLQEADSRQWTSIVLPVFGTGNRSLTTADAASVLVETVFEFASRTPQYLNNITVCIFQQQMFQEFTGVVERKASGGSVLRETSASGGTLGGTSFVRPVQPTMQAPKEPHYSSIVVHIYALSHKDAMNVVKAIEEVIRDHTEDKVLDSEEDQKLIKQLNEDQVERIKGLGPVVQAKITVERSLRLNRIRIQGTPKNVLVAIDQIRRIFEEVIKREHVNFVGQQAQWEYMDSDQFEPYPDEINVIIENAFQEHKPFAEWEEQDARFKLTFSTMVEETVGQNPANKVRVRRIGKDVPLPSSWESMRPDERYRIVQLDPSSAEFKQVEQSAQASSGTTIKEITKIERVQNPTLYKQYAVRKSDMDRLHPTRKNEHVLWHGTSKETLTSINDTGFNRSYCGRNATVYGRGVYFALDFSYSARNQYSPPDRDGVKTVYRCLVLTGDYAVGNDSMIVPPPKPGGGNYDSTVNDTTTPKIFVVFNDAMACPEYIISFKSSLAS